MFALRTLLSQTFSTKTLSRALHRLSVTRTHVVRERVCACASACARVGPCTPPQCTRNTIRTHTRAHVHVHLTTGVRRRWRRAATATVESITARGDERARARAHTAADRSPAGHFTARVTNGRCRWARPRPTARRRRPAVPVSPTVQCVVRCRRDARPSPISTHQSSDACRDRERFFEIFFCFIFIFYFLPFSFSFARTREVTRKPNTTLRSHLDPENRRRHDTTRVANNKL